MCGSVYTGLYIDTLPVPARAKVLVRAFALICVAIAVLSLPSTSTFAVVTPLRAVAWYASYGFFCGVWFVVHTMINADIFGRESLGRVNGVVVMMGTSSAGLGPLAFGWCR